jgi:hypothetical protein
MRPTARIATPEPPELSVIDPCGAQVVPGVTVGELDAERSP